MNPCKVTIMNRKNAEAYLSQVNGELTAMISIYGTDEEAISDGIFGNNVVEILRVCFDDVDCDEGGENGRRCISHRQGLEIAQFVKRVKDKVTRIIVHCGAGMSRSAGCAAAIMCYLYYSDEDIFSNALYKPNMKVYRTVLNALEDYHEYWPDPCSYLNSRAVSEYCRDINRRFDTLETAFIYGRNKSLSIEKKHDLYRQIIDMMPDMPLPERMRSGDHKGTVFSQLEKEIKQEDKLLDMIYNGSESAVYRITMNREPFGESQAYDGVYSSYDKAIAAIKDYRAQDKYKTASDIFTITVDFMNSDKYITAFLQGSDKICFLNCSDKIMDYYPMMYQVWVYIPTPFKKGDIVISTGHDYYDMSSSIKEPMIIKSICYWNMDDKQIEDHKYRADNNDMQALVLKQNAEGNNIFEEYIKNYHELDHLDNYLDPMYSEEDLPKCIRDHHLLKNLSKAIKEGHEMNDPYLEEDRGGM